MRGLYLSLLIGITVVQLSLCGFNAVSSNNLQISDLEQLSKIATTLDEGVDIVGVLHGTAHSNIMAGNFAKKVKFVDSQELNGIGAHNGFIVAYNDGTDEVLQSLVINDVAISELSKRGTSYAITGKALKEGSWCGTPKINNHFSAEFELKDGKINCIPESVTQSECPAVFANEAHVYSSICLGADPKNRDVNINIDSTTITLKYTRIEDSSIDSLHLVKSGANYILIGSYQGEGDIFLPPTTKKTEGDPLLHLSSGQHGLFALLIQEGQAVHGLDIVLERQLIRRSFVRVTGERVIFASVIEGDGTEIEVDSHKVKVTGNGVLLFDLVPQQHQLTSTWVAAYPFNAELRDLLVLNNYIFLSHDQPVSSVPLLNIRNVAVSVLDLSSDNKFTFVHGVTENNLTAGAIAVDGTALLLTAVNNDRSSLDLMFSETSLPEFMTRKPIVEPPKSTPPPPTPPPNDKQPTSSSTPPPPKPPVDPPKPETKPPVPENKPPTPENKPPPPPEATEAPKEPEKVPKAEAEPKPEVIKDNTATFSTSYVVIAVVVLVVFLGYVGFRFWKQQRADRQRQYGRVRMEDRIREENEFYNP